MSMIETFTATAKNDWTRYLRSKSLWILALAAPIAAHFMVPDKDAVYSVLTINGARPVLTAPVLGLELGILTATLLTPLAYIFLRAGPTRHRPWQISDVAPHSKMAAIFGRWVADTAALWILVAALTIAGLILGLFRLEDKANVLQTVWALWLPAAPSLALIAAIRLFLDARNGTRRWLGDVIFFFLWIALMITGTLGSGTGLEGGMVARPFTDGFGFTAPIVGSVDEVVTQVSIGGATGISETKDIQAWRGVTDGAYVASRFFWLAVSAGLALLAGLIWAPMKMCKSVLRKQEAAAATQNARTSIADIPFAAPVSVSSGSYGLRKVVSSNIRLLLRGKVLFLLLCATAIAGAILPFRTIAGPAILLALIFPLTDESARWEAPTLSQLQATMGSERLPRMIALLVAAVLVASAALLPAAIRAMVTENTHWLAHMAVIAIATPAVAIALGTLTRSPIAGRMILLITWYVYLSSVTI